MSRRPPRFWTWYGLAWIPYLAIVTFAYLSSGRTRLPAALEGALISGIAPAAVGILVVRLCRRLPWAPRAPGRFVAAHAGLMLAYALVVVTLQLALYMGVDAWRRGGADLATIAPAIVAWQLLMAMIVYLALAGITYTVETHARLRAEEERSARARALQTEAELAALRAQLNPHFLFNTLHTVLALVREEPARAERALEQFGDLLRDVLRVQRETRDERTLAEEWRFVRDYLALEQLRLGDRLRVDLDARPEALDCLVPVFCLQPLVENAIRHGIQPRAGGGTVAIAAHAEDGRLELTVADDGRGAGPGAAEGGDGLGLRLVRQRLETLHPGESALVVEPRPPGEGFAVRVRLPARRAR